MINAQQISNEYCIKNYGNLIMTDSPIFSETKNIWQVNLKSIYPQIIIDDNEPNKRELYFTTFSNLGLIIINNEGKIIEAISREKLVNKIDISLNIWEEKVESIILKACSNNLVLSPTVQHYLTPLRRIVNTILFTGSISEEELKFFPKYERAHEWMALLENLKLVKKVDSGYHYGDMWSSLLDKSNEIKMNPEHSYYKLLNKYILIKDKEIIFNNLIMSYVIDESLFYMKDIMRLKGMNRLININNIYYKPCIEANKILSLKPKTILQYYNKIHPEVKFSLISSILMELINIGLLNYKNGMIIGSDYHLNKMLENQPLKQVTLPL